VKNTWLLLAFGVFFVAGAGFFLFDSAVLTNVLQAAETGKDSLQIEQSAALSGGGEVKASETDQNKAAPASGDVKASLLPAPKPRPIPLDPSVAREAEAAISKALNWLAAHQKEDGSWSDGNYPALTALPLWAFGGSIHPQKKEITDKAIKYILSCVQTNGGIFRIVEGKVGGGLSTYNTAISMTGLSMTRRSDLDPVILKARSFLAATQYAGDDMYAGGFGYDAGTGRKYTDLMNTLFAVEAMRRTEGVEDTRDPSEKKADIDWDAARGFLARLQNNQSSGDEDYGGFPYRPDESKAGATTNEQGRAVFRSYGSMTYAGLMSMMYCKLSRNDPRVKSAFDWSVNNWSLEENPGMGPQGRYFFYHVLSKAMAAYGQDTIVVKDKGGTQWRAEVVQKLLSLQKTTPEGLGYWVNETGRFMESDPVLVTSYSILAMQWASGL